MTLDLQPAIGNEQALSGPHAQDGLQNGAGCQHQIGALAPDARLRDALRVGFGQQRLRDPHNVGHVQPGPVDLVAVVAR